MYVDIGAALGTVAEPGIDEAELEELDERVAEAHERIAAGRADDEFGYAALNLPERTDADAIREAISPVADAEYVLTVGIGGSALGAKTITSALAENPERHVVLDNVDPEHVERTLSDLPLSQTAINVVSKSGTTAETLANFLVVRDVYEYRDVDWTERTVVTTGESGPLRELADEEDLPTLPVPDGVPGRFSALSSVGLVPPAILGVDIEELLAGGADAADGLGPSLFETPAYAYGAVAYALEERGAAVNAFMPYAERLEVFAEWFAQLWAESLGKEGRGQTPARALGATDQHSQLQLYRAGPRDKVVTVVRPRERADVPVPEAGHESLDYLAGTNLGELLDAEYDATVASLSAAERPAVEIEIDRLDARSLGELLYATEAACVLVGELADVETFTQPAVEWGKRAARGLLSGEDTEETRTVAERPSYLISDED
ncbi:glucose-6-phosphate isomerase [Haloarcula amylovorans]|uniref:glucose-6-phosphate isomerase n=1 Tax=Haloarcula amylovorans TaxID=2562280 RepID=UPI00107600FE|nr:glucose-6-phosphate isomerase [Halomicroarcula amylolytica]